MASKGAHEGGQHHVGDLASSFAREGRRSGLFPGKGAVATGYRRYVEFDWRAKQRSWRNAGEHHSLAISCKAEAIDIVLGALAKPANLSVEVHDARRHCEVDAVVVEGCLECDLQSSLDW